MGYSVVTKVEEFGNQINFDGDSDKIGRGCYYC